ncbi:MAG: hypothetical protein ACE5D1_02490 [Fidelibacterota bacterium]
MLRRSKLVIALVMSATLAQGQLPSRPKPAAEWMGVRYQTSSALLSGLTIKNTVYTAGYESEYSRGSKILFYGGVSQTVIPSSGSTITEFKSDRALYLEGQVEQALGLLYFSGGFRRYSAVGTSRENLGAITNEFANEYTLWEFPVSAGLRETVGRITLAFGASKTYLYGKNLVKIKMSDQGRTTSFGSLNQSFIDQQSPVFSAMVRVAFSPTYSLGLTVESDGKNTTLIHITFYTPVKK